MSKATPPKPNQQYEFVSLVEIDIENDIADATADALIHRGPVRSDLAFRLRPPHLEVTRASDTHLCSIVGSRFESGVVPNLTVQRHLCAQHAASHIKLLGVPQKDKKSCAEQLLANLRSLVPMLKSCLHFEVEVARLTYQSAAVHRVTAAFGLHSSAGAIPVGYVGQDCPGASSFNIACPSDFTEDPHIIKRAALTHGLPHDDLLNACVEAYRRILAGP